METRGVPVVMYHGVGPAPETWQWRHLITPPAVFEGQMRRLREEGWRTITLARLHEHLSRGAALPARPVVLTFDDGYLDNWVYAYPILKKYGHHAVIWMGTDFVDPRGVTRPTLDDLWAGRVSTDELPVPGFLSWDEMRRMVESGHVEIQSHAKTHTWYPSGPEIIDFHRPRGVGGYEPPPWLAWNMFPERKYEYMTARLEDLVPYGTPVYRHAKALAGRRYFEDAELTKRLVERVADGGGPAFFTDERWRRELRGIVDRHPPDGGRFETEEEYEERVRTELVESRRVIGEAIPAAVDFLCWPGGGRNATTIRIAEEAGYLATTTHFLDTERRNVYGQNPREINRIGSGAPWMWRGLCIVNTAPGFFTALLGAFAGSKKSLLMARAYKLLYLFRHYLFGRD
jgi:peptidoglycan/xylan/chitin deacetylase (PgdA/CDA1 family)